MSFVKGRRYVIIFKDTVFTYYTFLEEVKGKHWFKATTVDYNSYIDQRDLDSLRVRVIPESIYNSKLLKLIRNRQ